MARLFTRVHPTPCARSLPVAGVRVPLAPLLFFGAAIEELREGDEKKNIRLRPAAGRVPPSAFADIDEYTFFHFFSPSSANESF